MTERSPSLSAVRLATVLLLTAVVAGCGLFYRSPSVQIADVRVVGLGFTAGTAEVLLQVENPNFFQLEVREFAYVLEIEDQGDRWAPLAEGRSEERIQLPRRSTEMVSLEIPFSYEALGVALRSWWDSGEVSYRIEGDLIGRGPTGEMNLPFRASGQMRPSLD